ncbi:MAG: RNA methyltransferase [Actinobacteria bacterium]|nr:RNA methyltransferase [Actinomycetota bacterium]
MGPAGYGDRVEGTHAVLAAARAGRVIRLYVETSRRRRPQVSALIEVVGADRVVFVDDVRPYAGTDSPQGVVAECNPIRPLTLEELCSGSDALMVLDHIEDPHNLGAIARSALAAGVGGLVLSARRQAPLSPAAFKSGAGALELLPVSTVGSIPEALSRLKDHGMWVVGLDARSERSLFGLDLLTEPVAIVVGAEDAGLAELTRRRCDLVVSIPMDPRAENLNASVSAALAAFEIMRVRRVGHDTDSPG